MEHLLESGEKIGETKDVFKAGAGISNDFQDIFEAVSLAKLLNHFISLV